jgi:hypothetical protein
MSQVPAHRRHTKNRASWAVGLNIVCPGGREVDLGPDPQLRLRNPPGELPKPFRQLSRDDPTKVVGLVVWVSTRG